MVCVCKWTNGVGIALQIDERHLQAEGSSKGVLGGDDAARPELGIGSVCVCVAQNRRNTS